MRTYFPEAHYMPDGNGNYRPTYRRYREDPFTLVPGRKVYATVTQAKNAAVAFLTACQPQIRAERIETNADPLGLSDWQHQRAGRAALEQEKALGAIIVKGKVIKVERPGKRAVLVMNGSAG